jgi:hypothetical protein
MEVSGRGLLAVLAQCIRSLEEMCLGYSLLVSFVGEGWWV